MLKFIKQVVCFPRIKSRFLICIVKTCNFKVYFQKLVIFRFIINFDVEQYFQSFITLSIFRHSCIVDRVTLKLILLAYYRFVPLNDSRSVFLKKTSDKYIELCMTTNCICWVEGCCDKFAFNNIERFEFFLCF